MAGAIFSTFSWSENRRAGHDTVVWNWDYFGSAFGENAPNEDPSNTGSSFTFNLRFPGQYYDAETGLNYNYFRDYEPGTGRYVESDPIGLAGGPNTYLYVKAKPLSMSDQLGLLTCGPEVPEDYCAQIKKAEQRIRKELQKNDGCCINSWRRHFKEKFAAALSHGTMHYMPTLPPTVTGKIPCGDTYVGTSYSWLGKKAFNNACYCLTDTIYHELLHEMGIDHDNPARPDDPNDEVNRMTSACASHLCGK